MESVSGRDAGMPRKRLMNDNSTVANADLNLNLNAASEYRSAHRDRLMLLTKLRSITPEADEFCRVVSVETLAPSLWLTVRFHDGSTRRCRPDKIRRATEEESLLSSGTIEV